MIDVVSLYVEHRQHVYNLLRRKLPYVDVGVIEDLAADTFERAWKARERYTEAGRPVSWLLTIAANIATDYQRRQRISGTVELTEWARVTTDAGNDRHADIIDGRAVLEAVSPEQRRVLELQHGHGMNRIEISAALGHRGSYQALKSDGWRRVEDAMRAATVVAGVAV